MPILFFRECLPHDSVREPFTCIPVICKKWKKIKANGKQSKALKFFFLQQGYYFKRKKTKPMQILNIFQGNLHVLGFNKTSN